MSNGLVKDRSIWALLALLASDVDSTRYQVVDHWDADLFAIGVAAVDDGRRLVYISTFAQENERYAVECEAPDGEESYIVSGRGERLSFQDVVATIRQHLFGRAPT